MDVSRYRVICGLVALLAAPLLAAPCWAYDWNSRWTSTKTDGGGIQLGDAITLTWSVVPDGESWSRGGPSDLIDYLDVGWSVAEVDRVPDLTNRPWWAMMDRVYEQYERVSGLTLTYEPEQDPNGSDTGKSGDLRIGGVPFTWENDKGGVLADNTYPNGGDMRIDTYRGSNGVPSFWHTNPAAFRNLISHESGHGVGLGHSDISGANAVMETPLETNFWGLQFDDIYAFNRSYGDPLEKNGGNDTASTAFNLGMLTLDVPVSQGGDAVDSSVGELDDDWRGIDGSTDEDWFRFSTPSAGSIGLTLTPLGPTYSTEEQGPNTDFSARSDLGFEVYFDSGRGLTLLADIDEAEAGFAEAVTTLTAAQAGEYLFRVSGEADLNQFYQFDLRFIDVTGVPGDVNQDGVLDTQDIDAFASGWQNDTTGLSDGERTMLGDLNLSGRTDISDAILLHQALTAAGIPGSFDSLWGTAVPEPSTTFAAVFGITLLVARRWRER